MNTPEVGKLIEGQAFRDAIHVAIAPMVAGALLEPGDRVVLIGGEAYATTSFDPNAIGIVDPFLTKDVNENERFWLFLFPNTVTSLRHVWTHPAFSALPPKEKS